MGKLNMFDAMLPAIKPMIKPAFTEMEEKIVEVLNNYPTNEGEEVAIVLVVRDNRLVIAPVLANDQNQISFSNELDENILKPQPLVPYILNNFQKAQKK